MVSPYFPLLIVVYGGVTVPLQEEPLAPSLSKDVRARQDANTNRRNS